ncbi:hypothetical protein ACHAXR_006467 [Thalassiosira sp. AJA248-18]
MSNNEINHHIDRLKESFLCAAARGGRIQECASLLDLGAEIEWHENNEDTPLLAAVRNGHQDCSALLLAHGANPAVRDSDGNTVMHLAAVTGDEGMASLFSPNACMSLRTNNDGMTAIDVAVQRGFNSYAEHLNNLLYEPVLERAESDEENDDQNLTGVSMNAISFEDAIITDARDDAENDLADDEASFSTPPNENEIQHTSTSIMVGADMESSIDEGLAYAVGNYMETDGGECSENDSTNLDFDTDGINQPLPHSQSRELYQAKYALVELMQERDALKKELAIFSGDDETELSKKSLAELNKLEDQVLHALETITKAKKLASSNLEEERFCVICRENPKSVLLMGCRHLCVCKECGHLDVLVKCPLCREVITERINVFS